MIASRKNKIIGRLFSLYHKRILYKHFHKIHISQIENFEAINENYPIILYGNHSNWWDGFIAYFISNCYLKKDDYLMMDIEQMKRYKFFKYIGAFSVNRNNAADAFRTINYASKLIKNTNRVLWIFPQGSMYHQDFRPITFYNGIIKITENAAPVQLIPIAFRYDFIMEQLPEVFIKVGSLDLINKINSNINAVYLSEKLTKLLDELKIEIILKQGNYYTLFKGKESRNKIIDILYNQ